MHGVSPKSSVDTLPQKSTLESLAGSLPTALAVAYAGALAGGLLMPLLPVLTNALAAERQRQRVEKALQQITDILANQASRLNDISDNQYKLVNETILTLLQTIDQEKIELLRTAVENTVFSPDISSQDTYFLSRLVRDISVQEVRFIQRNFQNEKISLVVKPMNGGEGVLSIQIQSEDGRIAAGLVSLGVLAAVGGTIDDLGTLRFTPIAAQLLALLSQNSGGS